MLPNDTPPDFQSLGLSEPVLRALLEIGYETPSPIQAKAIPEILAGRDILGQAQTGTGKTAAFALPILSRIDMNQRDPQVLVLAPTRELAIQVAEAFQSYAHNMPGFHVLPIYGGQSYDTQLRQLKRGVHVVVGTPGRVMDHIRRNTLNLGGLKTLVLDEADEMLRMGFIDDVEWIMEQIPSTRQIALFSATMPREIKKVVDLYLQDPAEIRIESTTTTAATIRQRYWFVSGLHKLEALTRILETEEFGAVIIFVRTKNSTVDLAERLCARGYAAEALNGDIPQNQRERIVDRLKKGSLDIVVATDVAARGLDVERMSHVINFDIPHDVESYVHRIGRTGRAGRAGDAILFVSNRERRLLRSIEHHTRQPIEEMEMPTMRDINIQRVEKFKNRITQNLSDQDLDFYIKLINEYQQEHDTDPSMIAAALAFMAQGSESLVLPQHQHEDRPAKRNYDSDDGGRRERRPRDDSERPPRRAREGDDREDRGQRRDRPERSERPRAPRGAPDLEMERYRIDVGREHKVTPTHIVGAIANEADMDSQFIGRIEIFDDHSTVDLPAGMPKPTQQILKKVWVCGQRLNLRPERESGATSGEETRPARDFRAPRDGDRRPPSREGAPRSFAPKKGGKADAGKDAPRKKLRERDTKNKGKPKRHDS